MKKLMLVAALVAAVAVHADEPKPVVSFVNVAKALDGALLAQTVTNGVVGVIPVRTALASVDKVDLVQLADPAKSDTRLPKETALRVYFVSDKTLPPQLTSPGRWAIVNVRGLDKGADKAKYERRVLKLALKGLAFACGFGANQDVGRCVMSMGSFETLEGIDGTSASYSPFVAFPMMDLLSARQLSKDVVAE